MTVSGGSGVWRVLGVDPGSRRTGYGLVEQAGNRLHHVDNGVIVLNPKDSLPSRLHEIFVQLSGVIERFRPAVAVFEQLFFARNAQSALKLGHARGAAILAATRSDLPIFEYAPAQVKRAVTTSGRADKEQVQQMVKLLLGLPEVAQEDAADALAVAICHCHRRRFP